MKTITKILAIIAVLLSIAFAKSIAQIVGKSNFNNYNKDNSEIVIEKLLIDTSKKINAKVPIMVDESTRLDTTISAGNHLISKYTIVNLSEKKLNKSSLEQEMKKMLVKNQCGNEKMFNLLKMGVEYDYMYEDKDGNLIFSINIAKKDCKI